MNRKHLYALLRKNYTTIGVAFIAPQVVDYILRQDVEINITEAPSRSDTKIPSRTIHVLMTAKGLASLPDVTKDLPAWQRTAQATSHPLHEYTYPALNELDLKVGDLALVNTTTKGLSVVLVTSVHAEPQINIDADFEYKWVVDRVDPTFFRRVESEKRKFDALMRAIEAEKMREQALQSIMLDIPEGSTARQLFNSMIADMEIKPLESLTMAEIPTVSAAPPPPAPPVVEDDSENGGGLNRNIPAPPPTSNRWK